MLDGSAQAFIGLGGNFARATPDSPLIAKALMNQKLTVNIATKLNHSHLLPGGVSYVLPCLGRTEIDRNPDGIAQIVTVEDSMSMVHGSGGINKPASPELRSEIAIIAGIAEATIGSEIVDWRGLSHHYDRIRDLIERTIPGFHDFNERVRKPRGFRLPNGPTERIWNTRSGKAVFSDDELPNRPSISARLASTAPSCFKPSVRTTNITPRFTASTIAIAASTANAASCSSIPLTSAKSAPNSGDRVDIIGLHEDGIERIAEASASCLTISLAARSPAIIRNSTCSCRSRPRVNERYADVEIGPRDVSPGRASSGRHDLCARDRERDRNHRGPISRNGRRDPFRRARSVADRRRHSLCGSLRHRQGQPRFPRSISESSTH